MAGAERANRSLAALCPASCLAYSGMDQRVMARHADCVVWARISEASWHAGAGMGLDWRRTHPARLLRDADSDRPAHRFRALPLFYRAGSHLQRMLPGRG